MWVGPPDHQTAARDAGLDRQFAAGARIVSRSAGDGLRAEGTRTELPLFAVARNGRLSVAADGRPPDIRPGDTVIALAAVGPPAAAPMHRSSVPMATPHSRRHRQGNESG
jgi:hypothetical protein